MKKTETNNVSKKDLTSFKMSMVEVLNIIKKYDFCLLNQAYNKQVL